MGERKESWRTLALSCTHTLRDSDQEAERGGGGDEAEQEDGEEEIEEKEGDSKRRECHERGWRGTQRQRGGDREE